MMRVEEEEGRGEEAEGEKRGSEEKREKRKEDSSTAVIFSFPGENAKPRAGINIPIHSLFTLKLHH